MFQCNNHIKETTVLWIAFQPNSVADIVMADKEFEGSLNQMKLELQNFNNHFPLLRSNMRNSGPISGIEVEHKSVGVYQTSIHVNHLKSTVTGPDPVLMRVPENFLNSNLDDVLLRALKHFASASSLVVLHDKAQTSTALKQALENLNTGYTIRTFDPDEQGNSFCIDEFQRFAQTRNNEILVSHADFITGIETANLLYLMIH